MPLCGKCHREAPEGALFCSFCGGAIRPVTAEGEAVDPLIGQTIAQKYFIHELLGHGGMGDVYKATHLTLDRPVVLKLLKKLFHSDPSLVQRFHREARASSRLNHPNSISIIDFGQTDDGTLFMAMEYLAGKSLELVIAEEHPLAEGRVVHIVAQILAALGEAHALGIIHRDLKPANVMIEPRRDEPDFVKVLDFGIAKLNEPGSGGAGLTQAGIVCGTPGYMSPEQVRGEDLDPRSDLYAVGVILYEMLAGVLPFESDTPMGLVTKHLVEDPPPIALRRPGVTVSEPLEAVIMTALARGREQRFSSADEMRAALLACAPAAQPYRATPPPSSTMVFDPAAVGGAGTPRPPTGSVRPPTGAVRPGTGSVRPPTGAVRPGTGSVRPVTGAVRPGTGASPSRGAARPTPMRAFTEALPAQGGFPGTGVEAAPPPAPRAVSSPRMVAPATTPPAAAQASPAPPAQATPAPAPARRAPAPVAAPAPRSKVPIIAGAGVVAAVIVAVVVWGVTRSPSSAAPATGTRPAAPTASTAPAQQAHTEPMPLPPAPAPAAAPAAAIAAEPAPAAPPVVAATAEPTALAHPASKPAHHATSTPRKSVASAATGASKGVRLVKPELNAIPTPPAASGDGVLAVVATPWAQVEIDGKDIGETPREVQLGAGTYKVKATHPSLGQREKIVNIQAGRRLVWTPTFQR